MFRPSSVQISRWWDYFQSFNDPQICSVDVGSHVRVGSSAIVVWNLPHLQNWWTAARATQEIIEKTGSIPIVGLQQIPKKINWVLVFGESWSHLMRTKTSIRIPKRNLYDGGHPFLISKKYGQEILFKFTSVKKICAKSRSLFLPKQ